MRGGTSKVDESGGLDLIALADANEEYNKKMRARHDRDFEEITGIGYGETLLGGSELVARSSGHARYFSYCLRRRWRN